MKSKCGRFIYLEKNIKHVFCFQLTSKCGRFIYFGKKYKTCIPFPTHVQVWDSDEVQVWRFIYFGKKYKTCIPFPTHVQVWGSDEVQVWEIYIFWEKNIKHVFCFQLTSKCGRFIYFGKK